METGPTRALLTLSLHPYMKAFLRCVFDLDEVGTVRRGIPGTPPRPDSMPPGCRFQPRCEFAVGSCLAPQRLEAFAADHLARCVRAEELAGATGNPSPRTPHPTLHSLGGGQ